MRALTTSPSVVVDGAMPSVQVTVNEEPLNPSFAVTVHIGAYPDRMAVYGPDVEFIAARLEALAAEVRAAHVSVAA